MKISTAEGADITQRNHQQEPEVPGHACGPVGSDRGVAKDSAAADPIENTYHPGRPKLRYL